MPVNNGVRNHLESSNKRREQLLIRYFPRHNDGHPSFSGVQVQTGKTLPITEAQLLDGSISTNPDDIITTHRSSCSNTFSAHSDASEHPPPPIDRKPLLDSIQVTPLDQERANLDTALATEEILNVILSLPLHKSTGLDGLRVDIFQLQI